MVAVEAAPAVPVHAGCGGARGGGVQAASPWAQVTPLQDDGGIVLTLRRTHGPVVAGGGAAELEAVSVWGLYPAYPAVTGLSPVTLHSTPRLTNLLLPHADHVVLLREVLVVGGGVVVEALDGSDGASEVLETALGREGEGGALDLTDQDPPLPGRAGPRQHRWEGGGGVREGPGVKVDVLAGVGAADGRDGGARLLGGGEVVRCAEPRRAGVRQHCVHKVQSDPADVWAHLGQSVPAGPGGLGGGGVAGVDDVGHVELEVVTGAVTDVEDTAGAKALGTGAEDDPSPGIALGPADTDPLQHSHWAPASSNTNLTAVPATVHRSFGNLVTWNMFSTLLLFPPVVRIRKMAMKNKECQVYLDIL